MYRRVLAPVVVGALAAAALALLLPARYRATALVQVEWSAAGAGLSGEVRRVMTESALLERVISETTPYAPASGAAAPSAQVERLRSDLRVRPMSTSSFAVEFEHRDPVTAASVPNALARALVEQRGLVRFELLRPAIPPDAPESSDPSWFAFAGAAFGLVLGLGAALVAELRDERVKGPEDLEDILPVPLLTTLPEVRERSPRGERDGGL
jgi:uncharacterized protein involved in exopolysaccharide biosynthesis